MELKNLQDIFHADRIFRVPDYQRGYAWEEKQLKDIWQDINNLSDDKIHYTGLLSVDPQGEKIIHVVDGQQRLTTLIILIHVICNSQQLEDKEWINEQEKTDYIKKYLYRRTGKTGAETQMMFGYDKDNPSHIHFKTKILGLRDTEMVPDHTMYTNNLDSAKRFFEDKIKALSFDEIELVLEKVTEQLRFLYYPLDDRLNQFVTFETLNYRGKDLTKLELLKNRLMYLSTELPENSDDEKKALRRDINNAWKTVYEYLGKNPKKKLSDDAFLMGHWIMYFDEYDRSASQVYASFLLDEHFTFDQVSKKKITFKDIRNYVLDVQKVVVDWYYTHNPGDSNYSDEIKTWLGKLNRIKNFGAFRPLAASLLSNKDAVEETEIVETLKNAERFNFVVLGLNLQGKRSNFKAVPIYKSTYQAHKSPSQFDPETVSLSGLEVGAPNFTFSRDKLYDKMWDGKEQGFYEWNEIRYFLYEYEIHLQKKARNKETKLHWEQVNAETIEHIYPQNPEPKCWPKFRSQGAKYHLHELGNLMLFPRSRNSELGNRSFSDKKTEYKTGSYSAIEVSKETDWTKETIQTRQERMLDFLYDRWDITDPESNT